MPEYLSRDIKVLLSAGRESTYNTAHTLAAEVIGGIMQGRGFGIPTLDSIDDLGKTGTGFEFATYLRPNYWQNFSMTIADDLNTGLGALLFARALGGTHAAPTLLGGVGSEVNEHTLLMQTQSQGRQLPSFNVITSVGRVDATNSGADFQFPGCVVDSVTISQTRSDPPSISCDLVGSGKFITPVPTAIATATIPQYNTQDDYVHGAAVGIVFNDGQAVNLSSGIRSWSFTYNNNCRRDDRRPGDPFRTANDPSSGAYVSRVLRGPRTCAFSTTVSLTENFSAGEFLTHAQGKTVTSLIITVKGNRITPAGTLTTGQDNRVFEIQMPKSRLRTITGTDENDEAAITLDFFPLKGSGEYVQGRIVNTRATALL